jgi:hypothetical protein
LWKECKLLEMIFLDHLCSSWLKSRGILISWLHCWICILDFIICNSCCWYDCCDFSCRRVIEIAVFTFSTCAGGKVIANNFVRFSVGIICVFHKNV